MFEKIKEFIKAFNYAYNTINTNKTNARKIIDDYSRKVDHIAHAADSLKIIYERLEEIYYYFPIKERRDFINKTLVLLRDGNIKHKNCSFESWYGLVGLYSVKANEAKYNLLHLNELYKEEEYDEVKEYAKKCLEKIEEFYVLYGIKEISNERIKATNY